MRDLIDIINESVAGPQDVNSRIVKRILRGEADNDIAMNSWWGALP